MVQYRSVNSESVEGMFASFDFRILIMQYGELSGQALTLNMIGGMGSRLFFPVAPVAAAAWGWSTGARQVSLWSLPAIPTG
jgi:hypothetical protein